MPEKEIETGDLLKKSNKNYQYQQVHKASRKKHGAGFLSCIYN